MIGSTASPPTAPTAPALREHSHAVHREPTWVGLSDAKESDLLSLAEGGAEDHVAVLLLADIASSSRLWGWSRIMLGSRPLRQVPGLQMAKALGSGHEGGFGLRPSASRQGLFLIFRNEACADHFIHQSTTVAEYHQRALDFVIVKLRATSSRGAWSGRTLTPTAAVPRTGPVAALTRASIRPGRAIHFWRHSPLSERALSHAAGCHLAVGLGEAPVLRQATFSLWDSQAAMDAYARSGAHLDAIRAAQAGGWFSESMFVRFVPVLMQGQWQGRRYG
jgi:spheroidene monooxygenase